MRVNEYILGTMWEQNIAVKKKHKVLGVHHNNNNKPILLVQEDGDETSVEVNLNVRCYSTGEEIPVKEEKLGDYEYAGSVSRIHSGRHFWTKVI